jgi:hypothetical protein
MKRRWLRRSATSWNVAGSSPDEVIEFCSSPIYLMFAVALGPGVYSASNRDEHQKHTNNVCGECSTAGA